MKAFKCKPLASIEIDISYILTTQLQRCPRNPLLGVNLAVVNLAVVNLAVVYLGSVKGDEGLMRAIGNGE